MDSAGHSYTDLRYGYLKPWVAVVGNPAEDSLCKRFWAGGLSSWLSNVDRGERYSPSRRDREKIR